MGAPINDEQARRITGEQERDATDTEASTPVSTERPVKGRADSPHQPDRTDRVDMGEETPLPTPTVTARERWEQALRDAWRASIDVDDMATRDILLVVKIGDYLGRDVCNQIYSEFFAERDEQCPNCRSGHKSWSNFDHPVCPDPWHKALDRVSRSQPSTQVVGTVEAQDRETQ